MCTYVFTYIERYTKSMYACDSVALSFFYLPVCVYKFTYAVCKLAFAEKWGGLCGQCGHDPISQMAILDSQGCLKRRWPVKVASLARIAAGTACQVTVVTGYPALKDPCASERFAEGILEQMPLEVLRICLSYHS